MTGIKYYIKPILYKQTFLLLDIQRENNVSDCFVEKRGFVLNILNQLLNSFPACQHMILFRGQTYNIQLNGCTSYISHFHHIILITYYFYFYSWNALNTLNIFLNHNVFFLQFCKWIKYFRKGEIIVVILHTHEKTDHDDLFQYMLIFVRWKYY